MLGNIVKNNVYHIDFYENIRYITKMKTSAVPIRCIKDKPHGIYDHCGSLLGAIDGDSVFFHCKNCSVWYSVYRDDNGALTIKPMDKEFRFDFQDELKIVEEA